MQPQLGVVPPADKLKGMVKKTKTEDSSAQNLVPPSKNARGLLKDDKKRETSKSEQQNALPESSKQYLVAPGLPTISRKLAQRIWELEFIEMEEFLPSNKAIQALELAGITEGGVHRAM